MVTSRTTSPSPSADLLHRLHWPVPGTPWCGPNVSLEHPLLSGSCADGSPDKPCKAASITAPNESEKPDPGGGCTTCPIQSLRARCLESGIPGSGTASPCSPADASEACRGVVVRSEGNYPHRGWRAVASVETSAHMRLGEGKGGRTVKHREGDSGYSPSRRALR